MSSSSRFSTPLITSVEPRFSLPGADVTLCGSGLLSSFEQPPQVFFGEALGTVVFGSATRLVTRVPESASSWGVTVSNGTASNTGDVRVASLIGENLHPVGNPAVDMDGNVYVTFSGSRGQSVPVSVFRIDADYNIRPFVSDLMNPTGLALDASGNLYVSSRNDGTVYRVSPNGQQSTYAQGMGIATGIAFDREGNLYVGDRSGTIFKIGLDRQIFVFATLEPSVAAYHLAFSPNGNLYVTGPTTSSNDCIYEIDPHGAVQPWMRNLGRPQGLAFDVDGNVYVAASYRGQRGIFRVTPDREISLMVSGLNLVGLAFAPGQAVILVTNNSAYHLPWGISGYSLLPDM